MKKSNRFLKDTTEIVQIMTLILLIIFEMIIIVLKLVF